MNSTCEEQASDERPRASSSEGAEPAASQHPAGPRLVSEQSGTQPNPYGEWLGRVIDDRYRIVKVLGEGGMGTVFVAEHVKLRKLVALKAIHAFFAGNDEVAVRFAREAMASAQLEHPHVASAVDYGTLPEGGAYLVLQLVQGPTLRDQIEAQGPSDWTSACEVTAQIADALAAAHAMGIVHRDLKPENVMLEARHAGTPIVKVLDFGIARVRAAEQGAPEGAQPSAALTQVGAVMGTPGYMSPEQACGGDVGASTDLYALGVVLWEMLVGQPPFEGDNLTELITQQHSHSLPPVHIARGEGSSVPLELERLVRALLEPMPADRPQSASAVRDTLRALALQVHGMTPDTGSRRLPTSLMAQRAARQLGDRCRTLWDRAAPHVRTARLRTWQFLRSQLTRTLAWHAALPQKARRQLAAAVGALLLLVSVSTLMLASAEEPANAVAHPQDQQARPSTTPTAAAADQDDDAPPRSEVDPAVTAHLRVLFEAPNPRQRRAAARWLRQHGDGEEVPKFAAPLANLELSRDCRARAKAVHQLGELGDPQVLPALIHWARKPKVGCGFRDKHDCHACMRGPLHKAIRALRAAEPAEG